VGYKPASKIDALLYQLCVGMGHCLSSEDWARLLDDPPPDAESFADAVLRAEGIDPHWEDKRSHARFVDFIRTWLERPWPAP
jgi:hypothetical protein